MFKRGVRQREFPYRSHMRNFHACHRDSGELEWRRYGATLLGGKVAGVGITLLVMAVISGLFFTKVYAADAPVTIADVANPVNTAWTLVAAFLVFGMQVGFTMLEAGFCRSRETVNVLMECIVDTCLCGILFYAIGFAFMFSHGNGFIGYHWFFLQGAPDTYESTGVAFLAVWIFQFGIRRQDMLDDHFRHAMIGRTEIHRRSALFARRVGIYLSDYWSLGHGVQMDSLRLWDLRDTSCPTSARASTILRGRPLFIPSAV